VGYTTTLVQPQTPCNPSVNTYCAGFGQITNTINTPRQFQFGARFTF
jgi:hypothetical protein